MYGNQQKNCFHSSIMIQPELQLTELQKQPQKKTSLAVDVCIADIRGIAAV